MLQVVTPEQSHTFDSGYSLHLSIRPVLLGLNMCLIESRISLVVSNFHSGGME